jgi:hypothetical protein
VPTDNLPGLVVIIKYRSINLSRVPIKPPSSLQINITRKSIGHIVQHQLPMMVHLNIADNDVQN